MGDFPPLPEWARVQLSALRLRRGETLEVDVAVAPHGDVGGTVELGLACLAYFAMPAGTRDGDMLRGRFRLDHERLLHEQWCALSVGSATLTFAVPGDAPYGYEGELLSFYWGLRLRAGSDLLGYVPLVVEP